MAIILSLDDDPITIKVLCAILTDAGYESLGTTDDQEALSILRTQPIDLFTQDFMRPGSGGCEFLRQMKSEEALRSIPVLGISAMSRDTIAERLKQVGLDIDRDLNGYFRKPPMWTELLDAIEVILR